MASGWPIRGNSDLHDASSCSCTIQLHLCRIPESCHWISPGTHFKSKVFSNDYLSELLLSTILIFVTFHAY